MKHLKKISRPKQKKADSPPRGQIGKIITLSLIGVGAYLLLSRQKAFAEEAPEEYTPSEKPQDQLTKELYEQLSPSTIVERATEIATVAIKEATEKANIEIQQIKEATATTIAEIIKKADENLETLKREMEASTMKTEDLIREYRARDEVIRAEAEQKIELARIEAEQKDQAVRDEAARQIEIARIEAEQKVQAARIETARIEAARLAEIEAARLEAEKKPIQLASTAHSYRGQDGPSSIDGYFDTYQVDIQPPREGKPVGASSTSISQHLFAKAHNITSLRYKMYGYAYYTFEGGASVTVKIEYTTDRSNWITVPGTLDSGTGGHGYMGKGTKSDKGDISLAVDIKGCVGIRASIILSASDRDGWVGTEARIYEIQAIATP